MPQVVRNLRFKHPTMKQRLEEILYLDAKSRIDLPPGQKPVLTDRQIALSASYINALSQHAFHHPEHASLLVDDRYVNGVTSKTMFCLLALAFRMEPEDPNESCGYPEADEFNRAERMASFGPGALYEVEVVETMAACQEFATYRVVDDVPEKAVTGYEDGKHPRGRCIYIIECRTGRIKIGVSKQPRQRIRGLLSTGGVQHDAIYLSGAFLNATEVEAAFKRKFADLKIEGEWFDTTAAKAIEFLLSQYWKLDTLADAESDAVGDRVRWEARDAWLDQMFRRTNVAA